MTEILWFLFGAGFALTAEFLIRQLLRWIDALQNEPIPYEESYNAQGCTKSPLEP